MVRSLSPQDPEALTQDPEALTQDPEALTQDLEALKIFSTINLIDSQ